MAKRRSTDKTQRQRSAPSKPSRQERRQAARDDARAQQTVETASPLTAVTSYSRWDVLAFLALGLLVVISYLPAMLWGGFVWDDHLCITVDPVREVSGLWQIWFSPSAIEEEAHYWPLVYTMFWLEHKLWGFDPTGYHIVNVLLHLANTLLVWHLLRRLAIPGAWMVAAVFAVHPLHVESVAWAVERKDVLSGLFYLAAALAWMRFVEQPNPRWYVWSLVLYAAGLLSKSIVVTLPAALVIWHWWETGPRYFGRSIAVGAVLCSRVDHHDRRLVVLPILGSSVSQLLINRTYAYCRPRPVVLCGEAVVADEPSRHISALGHPRRRSVGLGVFHRRCRIGGGSLASPTAAWTWTAGWGIVFCGDVVAGVGLCRLWLYAVCFCRRPFSVSRWHWGYGCRHRYGRLWRTSLVRLVAKGALSVAVVALVILGMLTWRQASIYRDDETFYRHIIALTRRRTMPIST